MNVLVTAGGTCEPIDDARCISNTGTGRLGSLIADALAEKPEIDNIFYICAKSACRPATDRATVIPIFSVEDLEKAVRDLLRTERIDAVVHSMAVSDYRVRSVSTVEQLQNALTTTDDIYQALDMTDIRSGGKLSSQMGSPLLLLEQTPKILPLFRELAPETFLIGFKLLSGVTRERLFEVAKALLEKNGCDLVLANDITQISGDTHKAYLLDGEPAFEEFDTKQEIAQGIAARIIREVQI